VPRDLRGRQGRRRASRSRRSGGEPRSALRYYHLAHPRPLLLVGRALPDARLRPLLFRLFRAAGDRQGDQRLCPLQGRPRMHRRGRGEEAAQRIKAPGQTLKSTPEGCPLPEGPVHLLIDSTGLNIYGAGEWSREKHSAKDVTIVRKRAFEFYTNLARRV